jgi:monoamine oxidase
VFFVGGKDGRDLEDLSEDAVRTWLHTLLQRALLGLPDAPSTAPDPTFCHITRWSQDPYALGSYTYIPAAIKGEVSEPASPLDLVELSRPLWDGRLGFAGEHTEMDHYASVHGALISGWREAARMRTHLEGPWAETRRDQ